MAHVTSCHRATHAIAQSVFRGRLTAVKERIQGCFSEDCGSSICRQVDMPEAVFETGIALARAHVARLGVHTLDTLHVAAALELEAERFWIFDAAAGNAGQSGWVESLLSWN